MNERSVGEAVCESGIPREEIGAAENILFFNIEFLMHAKTIHQFCNGLMDFL